MKKMNTEKLLRVYMVVSFLLILVLAFGLIQVSSQVKEVNDNIDWVGDKVENLEFRL